MLARRGPGTGLFSFSTGSVVIACGIGLAVWRLRSPYPYAFPKSDIWRIRLLVIETRILSWIARFGSALHLGSQVGILRYLYRAESFIIRNPPKNDSKVFTEVIDADGVKIMIYRRLDWVATEEEPVSALMPCLLYLHGGGFLYCCIEERDSHHRHFIEHLDAVVVAIDYRKGPEHLYPAAFHDAVTATKYVHTHSLTLGIDRTRITICGDSAGGNLSASVALKLRDEGQKFLKNQILIYPSVQFLNLQLNSYMGNYPLLSREDCAWLGLMYIGEDTGLVEAVLDGDHISEDLYQNAGFLALQKYDSSFYAESKSLAPIDALAKFKHRIKDPYLCPLMARTMRGLPKTLMLLCDFDVLLDDGLAYADRLAADGVTVTTVRVPGYHGCFRNFQITHCGGMMMDRLIEYLRENM